MNFDISDILDAASCVDLSTVLLGGIFISTSLSAYLTWRLARSSQELDVNTVETEGEQLATLKPVKTKKLKDLKSSTPLSWSVDGATRTGKVRTENQDAFIIWRESVSSVFMAVFDGAGGVAGGREAAQTAAKVCETVIKESAGSALSPLARLEQAIAKARQLFREKELTGITTAILTLVVDDILYYATLGDGALAAIWPDGMVGHIQTPHHVLGQPSNIITAFIGRDCEVRPRTGCLTLDPDTTIMLMSDGISDLFPYADFAENRDIYSVPLSSKDNHGMADHFIAQVERARDLKTQAYLHSDNMTLVLGHLSDGGLHKPLIQTLEDDSDG